MLLSTLSALLLSLEPSGSGFEATVTAQEWMETSAVLKFMPATLLVLFASERCEPQREVCCAYDRVDRMERESGKAKKCIVANDRELKCVK